MRLYPLYLSIHIITSKKIFKDFLSFLLKTTASYLQTCQQKKIKITHGQIESVIINQERYDFAVRKVDYRPNEILALEKDQLAEAWIVYNYLKKKYSQKISDLYLTSAQKLKKEMGF